MDRRKSLLLNRWEVAADAALAEAADRCGLRVLSKVRLSSALDLTRSGLPDELFNYATRAELDFVVVDGTDAVAQFAVEYDGEAHVADPDTMRRDRMKSEICSRLGLPLVRIDSPYLQRERGFTLIGYLVEMWDLERAFTAAQERGEIPYDEPFMPELILSDSRTGPVDFPYLLDQPARLLMARAEREGQLRWSVPEELTTPWPPDDRDDDVEMIESWSLLELRSSGYIIGHARLRNHPVFVPGVAPRGLAATVAVADAGLRLKQALAGDRSAVSTVADLTRIRTRTSGWESQGGHVHG